MPASVPLGSTKCAPWGGTSSGGFEIYDLFEQATTKAKEIGQVSLTRTNPFDCRLVLVRQPKRGRSQWTLSGQRARNKLSEQHAKREREPWLLATSLNSSSRRAHLIVKTFSGRMQIEEAFRDLKSAQFGLGFELSRSTITTRITVLLLIAMLTLLIAWLIGRCVELSNKRFEFQANTEKHRKVLSTIFLARRAVHDPSLQLYPLQLFLAQQHLLCTIAAARHQA